MAEYKGLYFATNGIFYIFVANYSYITVAVPCLSPDYPSACRKAQRLYPRGDCQGYIYPLWRRFVRYTDGIGRERFRHTIHPIR